MNKKIATFFRLLVLMIFFSHYVNAQQHPQYSLFSYNMNVYNPAYTGITNNFSLTLHGRAQWLGIDGTPLSQNIVAQSPVSGLHGGAGITLLNNQQGLQRNTHAGVDYAYIIRKPKYLFSIGVRGGIIQSSLDGSKIITPEGSYNDGNIDHNDPILPTSIKDNVQIDAAVGVAFQSKRISIGAGAINLTEPKLSLTQNTNGPVLERNFFGNFSYNINLSKNVLFRNTFLVKYDLNDMQEETNIIVQYKQIGWIGVGYRGFSSDNNDACYALIGLRLSTRWTLGYSYDYALSDLSKATNGSHEVLLQYTLELLQTARPGKIVFTPRF